MKLLPVLPLALPSDKPARREGFGWVSSILDDLISPLKHVGCEWGPHAGLPWGAPLPLVLLAAYCTLLHRYNPAANKLEVVVSFGWYYLQGTEFLAEEEEVSSRRRLGESSQSHSSEVSEEGSEVSYGSFPPARKAASGEMAAGSEHSIDFYRPPSGQQAHGSSRGASHAADQAESEGSEVSEVSEKNWGGIGRLGEQSTAESRGRGEGKGWPTRLDDTAGTMPGGVSWRTNAAFDSDAESSFVSEDSEEDRERLVKVEVSFEERMDEKVSDGHPGVTSDGTETGWRERKCGEDRRKGSWVRAGTEVQGAKLAGQTGEPEIGGKSAPFSSSHERTLLELLSEVGSKLFEAASRGDTMGERLDLADSLLGAQREGRDWSSAGQAAFKYVSSGLPKGGGFQELAGGLPSSKLALIVVPRGNGSLLARWRYDRRVYDEPSVLRLAANYRHLVEKIAVLSSILERKKLSELPVLSQAERQLVERSFSRREANDALWDEDSLLAEKGAEGECVADNKTLDAGGASWQKGMGSEVGSGLIREARQGRVGLSEGLPQVPEEEEDAVGGDDQWTNQVGASGSEGLPFIREEEEDDVGDDDRWASSAGAGGEEGEQKRRLTEGEGLRQGGLGLSAVVQCSWEHEVSVKRGEKNRPEAEEKQVNKKRDLHGDYGKGERPDNEIWIQELLRDVGFDSRQTEDLNLLDIFERQAGEVPDAAAISDSLETLTYRELLLRAASIASFLTAKLVPQGEFQERQLDVVGIGMERCVDWVAAILGTLMAGKGYVPLDPFYPRPRNEAALEQTGLKMVLTNRECLDRFLWAEGWGIREGHAGVRVCTTGSLRGEPLDRLGLRGVRPKPRDMCAVLFANAVTGEPGGVVLDHKGVVNMLGGLSSHLPIGRHDVLGQCCDATGELHLLELFAAFKAGARVAICPQHDMEKDLNGFVQQNRVTGLVVPPSVVASMEPQEAPSLRWLALGGEVVPRDLVSKWTGGGRTVVEHYGPTECSGPFCCAIWRPGEKVREHIGRPLPGAYVYILGRQLELLPIGVPGEICVAGCQLARAYPWSPELAKRALVLNPYMTDQHDTRLYRTGDLARWHANGTIELLGRADRQVKVRGHRVELGEVEAAIQGVEGVRRCVVSLRLDDPEKGPYLAAYLTAKASLALKGWGMGSLLLRHSSSQESLAGRVRKHLQATLPAYMRPTAVTVLDHFPHTAGGEMDTGALQAPPPESFMDSERGGAPGLGEGGEADSGGGAWQRAAPLLRAPEELAVAALFAELLPGVEMSKLGPHANFFELGGNSLLACQALAVLRKQVWDEGGAAGGCRGSAHLTIRHFFEAPTVGGMAAALQILSRPASDEGRAVGSKGDGTTGWGEGRGTSPRETRVKDLGDSGVMKSAEGRQLGGKGAWREGFQKGQATGFEKLGSPGSGEGRQAGKGSRVDNARSSGGVDEVKYAAEGLLTQPARFQLSHAQWLVWVAMQVAPNPEALNVCHVWRLRGVLDVERLEEALGMLVRRHVALRTRLEGEGEVSVRELRQLANLLWGPRAAAWTANREKGMGARGAMIGRGGRGIDGVGGPLGEETDGGGSPGRRPWGYGGGRRETGRLRQSGGKGWSSKSKAGPSLEGVWQVAQDPSSVEFHLEVTSVQEVTTEGRSVASPSHWVSLEVQRALVQQLMNRARQLADAGNTHEGLPVRGSLVQVKATEHVLVLTWSRLIGDRISAAVLFRELQEVYESGTTEELPAVVPLCEVVEGERKVAEGEGRRLEAEGVAYWRAQLREVETLTLAGQKGTRGQAAPQEDWVGFAIGTAVSTKVEQLAARCGATLSMALLAAFHSLLHLWSGQLRVCVATLLGQRPTLELQGSVGPLADVVPIVTDLRQRRLASPCSPPGRSSSNASASSRPSSLSPGHSPSTNSPSQGSPYCSVPQMGGSSRGGGLGLETGLGGPMGGPRAISLPGGSSRGVWKEPGKEGERLMGPSPWQARGARGSHWLAEPGRPASPRGTSRASTRRGSEAESTVGSPAALTLEQVLEQVRERTIGALEHQRVSVCQLAVQLQKHGRGGRGAPLIPAFFSFSQPGVDSPPLEMGLGDDVIAEYDEEESWGVEPSAALAPVALMLQPESDGSLVGRMLFQSDMLYPEVVDAAVRQFEAILCAGVEGRPLAMAPAFTAAIAAAQQEEAARPRGQGVCLPFCCGNFSGMD